MSFLSQHWKQQEVGVYGVNTQRPKPGSAAQRGHVSENKHSHPLKMLLLTCARFKLNSVMSHFISAPSWSSVPSSASPHCEHLLPTFPSLFLITFLCLLRLNPAVPSYQQPFSSHSCYRCSLPHLTTTYSFPFLNV